MRLMSVEYFEERREMVAAIRVIVQHLAAEVGKATLDDRVLRAMAKVPRHEFVPVEVKPYAYLDSLDLRSLVYLVSVRARRAACTRSISR